ncbi:MAG TPA: hypothetical protein VF715_03015 [Thermoleophilaceae bacterium]
MLRAAAVLGLLISLLAPAAAAALDPYETVLVSRQNAADGGAPSADGYNIDTEISGDGRYVAFAGESANLAPGRPTTFYTGLYLRDLETETTTLIAFPAGSPSLSHDGRYLAYDAPAEGQDGAGKRQVYLRDSQTGTTTIVSRANGSEGAPADDSAFDPTISSDGRYVLFRSAARNLPGAKHRSTFLRDLRTGRTVAVGPRQRRRYDIWDARLSGNGRYAVFGETEQYDGCCAETYRFRIHRYDLRTGRSRVVFKLNHDGLDRQTTPAISASGRYVAFQHEGRFADGAGLKIYDAKTGRQRLLSRRSTVIRGNAPDLSASGRYVTFYAPSRSGFEGLRQWVYDRSRDRLHLASRAPGRSGAAALGWNGSISADGRTVAFDSESNNLPGGDTEWEQVYARRVLP